MPVSPLLCKAGSKDGSMFEGGFESMKSADCAEGILDVSTNKAPVRFSSGEGMNCAKHDFSSCLDAAAELKQEDSRSNCSVRGSEDRAGGQFDKGVEERDRSDSSIGFGKWSNPAVHEDACNKGR